MSTQDKTMKARSDTLQQYVSDMIAVEEHIGTAVKRQTEDKDVSKNRPHASQIIHHIARHTDQHAQHLKQHLESIGGDPAKGIKEVATSALGAIAGVYDKMRTEQVSKMLRDDYTALNLAVVGYTMLHATGLALQDQATADLALVHMQHYTTIIMELNQIIPSVVVADLRDDGLVMSVESAQQALENTQNVWKNSNNGHSHLHSA
jgi:hypothetical protein